ncbi:MAG: Hsp20/alpha crystallin family protein [Candidatus Obscuribacterales bacterium]|nr:Hsp20/alpha crystallin family protein [Candidatus Obscuribacterales bacterium]
MKNLLPWHWGARRVPVTHESDYPGIYGLQREMNRLLEEFSRGMERSGFPIFEDEQLSQFNPKLDLKETKNELIVSVEVPGMNEKDLEVSVCEGLLMIRGEKKEEKVEDLKGYYRMERRYGEFNRTLPLPYDIDSEKVEALFKNGVLNITLPKLKQAKAEAKSVPVKGS